VNEESLIPYRASELTGGRILVVAAHPDDEVLGAGGTLALSAEHAEAVRVWIATDGGAQEGAEGEAAAYGELRREESRVAARALGLSDPLFGALPDRHLAERPRELDTALASLLSDFQPDLVFCPSPVEIHPDHRALAEALYERVAASRPGDSDHGRFRDLRLAFYEISHPLLPNTLVDITAAAERKERALEAFVSQQAVRDYAGAVGGLNAYRRLTLDGSGPVEAFRVIAYPELSTRSLEEFRRSIGPAVVADGERGTAPVSVVVRTRNRPALLAESLESLRAQTARPAQVVIVNDGGAPVEDIAARFRDAFEVALAERSDRVGRSQAANSGVEAANADLVAFLDDDDRCFPDHFERLLRAFRGGPEPVVYSDAATVVYERKDDAWEERVRTLQYSLDFDPDYLLLANYIPLHTLLMPRALYGKAGGFDPELEYSEDWDFLIRLSFETSFRHIRAVTCEYRVFSDAGTDPFREAAGSLAFTRARARIYERYAGRRSPEALARVMDRLRAQIAFWGERDGISQGELRYQRESHRRLHGLAEKSSADLAATRARLAEAEYSLRGLETERSRLLAENEIVHARLAELFAANERYFEQALAMRTEIDRLNALTDEIFASRTWKLHLFLDRIRGRR
jgi:LmbE family N-acetylglucosaminyl deacetylase/glycosyltransferase involved in cell wall biosynthesis